jgi:RNA polymerase sigma-70 factor, ECF subfamily
MGWGRLRQTVSPGAWSAPHGGHQEPGAPDRHRHRATPHGTEHRAHPEHFGLPVRQVEQREAVTEIVVRAQAGETDAFEAIVHTFTPSVYRLARALVGEAEAQDVVQDVFLSVWRELPRLRDPDRFPAWLHRLAVNRCRSNLRRPRRVREIQVDPGLLEGRATATDFRTATDARLMIAATFGTLPLDQRTVIAMHYAAGLNLREVAEALDVPEGTVKSRLSAGLARLRREMQEQVP